MASVNELVNARCRGLNVLKDTVVACVRVTSPGGPVEHRADQEDQRFPQKLLAEIGTEMTRFPTEGTTARLSSND